MMKIKKLRNREINNHNLFNFDWEKKLMIESIIERKCTMSKENLACFFNYVFRLVSYTCHRKLLFPFIMKVINCLRRIMNIIFEVISSREEHVLRRNNTHSGQTYRFSFSQIVDKNEYITCGSCILFQNKKVHDEKCVDYVIYSTNILISQHIWNIHHVVIGLCLLCSQRQNQTRTYY